jgi:hypothetical protein
MNPYLPQYPTMTPYVGEGYYDAGRPSLLLIGESHYLPAGSTQHLESDRWYNGSSATLDEKELYWISTARIITESRMLGFTNRSHSIWRKSFQVINEIGPKHPDYRDVADGVAFYNFFYRPGLEGKSLSVQCEDTKVAQEAFAAVYDSLRPAGIVFLSKLAYAHWNSDDYPHVNVVATPHPGCCWWNRPAKAYNNRTGRECLEDFLLAFDWGRGG